MKTALLTLLLLPLAATAQTVGLAGGIQPQAQGPMGAVTGRVILSDTQHPARFAQVTLIATDSLSEDFDRRAQRFTVRTDLDGNFTANNIPVGDFYVTAAAAGYVSQTVQLSTSTGDAQKAIARRLPIVYVAAGAASLTSASIDRGAVISGRLMWEDGSAAAGVQVTTVSTSNAQIRSQRGSLGPGSYSFDGSFGSASATDDRGMFRLSGLAAGEYLVQAMVQAPLPVVPVTGGRENYGRIASIRMYAPGKVRSAEARAITVAAGQETDGVDFTLDLGQLHTVSGVVSGGSDGARVASGSISIIDSTDRSLSRFAQIREDGSFTLSYVPAGTYTMSVPYASTTPISTNTRQRGSRGPSAYQPFQQTLTVTDTDVRGVPVTLTPATAQ